MNFDAGVFWRILGWMEGVGASYDEFIGLDKSRRLTSSPSVVDVHTKTRSRSG